MKKFLKKILTYALIVAGIFAASVVGYGYFKTNTLTFNTKYFSNAMPIAIFACAVLLLLKLIGLMDKKSKKGGAKDVVTDVEGNETSQFFNTGFVTEKQLETDKAFNFHTLNTIRTSKKDGVLVRAEEKGNNMHINFVQPIHTLVVGTTSSGKTWRYVVPTLQIMCMTAAKPSFVVTDPKGELYDTCSNKLRKEGYDVHILDLANPFRSSQWNPLTYPYKMWHRSFSLDKEVKVHPPGDNPKNYNLLIQREFDHGSTTWFEFNGTAFVDRDVLEAEMRTLAVKLKDDTFAALNDICTTVAPVENERDSSWEKTAQKLIQAVLLAMLEDSLIPELGLTEEKYNFYNAYKICNTTDNGRDTFATLKKYLFENRDQFSKVPDLASTALQNADTTTKNYMGFVSSKMALFADTGISLLTSKSEMDFVNMDEKPTAIFLIVPDETRVRHHLAILFVTQLYKKLVEKARGLGGRLKRNIYFLLDEFGNMPKFPEFASIMTVGRSRGIFFTLCVQSYSQLYQVYGQDQGKIIKENCPIQVYVASEDTTTNKEFSELLGNKTISEQVESKSIGPDGKESKTINNTTKSIPLAYPHELMKFRDAGQLCIKTFTPNCAMRNNSSYFHSLKCGAADLSKPTNVFVSTKFLDEDAIFFDIKKRIDFMNKKSGNGFDDEDDDDLF